VRLKVEFDKSNELCNEDPLKAIPEQMKSQSLATTMPAEEDTH
jgi:hypothetical protein